MVRLRDLGNWSGGNTPSKANPAYWNGGSIPWVSPKDMKVDEIASSEDRISEVAVQDGRASVLSAGSVLIVTRSGILAHTLPVAVSTVPVTINQDLKALAPRHGVSPKYVAHALRGASRKILKRCAKHGTTVASLETDALLEFTIPMVPFDEQLRVVAEIEKQFSRLDEAVANLRRVRANLGRHKTAILRLAFEGLLVETEAGAARKERRTYEGADALLRRILEDRRVKWDGRGRWREPQVAEGGTPLPEGWTWATIDQLAEVGTGATPKRENAAYWVDGDVPWVTSTVVNGYYVDEPSEFVTRLALAETNLTVYPAGTLLIAMYGEGKTRGKCSELRIPAATNQALAALQAHESVRSYLRRYLELSYEGMRKAASGGVQPNLNLASVRSVSVPLAPVAEQRRIVAEVDRRLSIVREVEAEVDANLKRARALRQAILAKAFGG